MRDEGYVVGPPLITHYSSLITDRRPTMTHTLRHTGAIAVRVLRQLRSDHRFLGLSLAALLLVRERTAQTLARMFVNGYRQAEIIGGYVLAYTGLATVQSLLVLATLRWLF